MVTVVEFYLGSDEIQYITLLFSEGLSSKLDETLNTLLGVTGDPLRTPKKQRKIFHGEFLTPNFHWYLNLGPLVEVEITI